MILYVFLACVVTFQVGNYLYSSGRTVTLVFAGILFILIFVFFGIRWFQYRVTTASRPATGPWPPIINTCPDYMTLVNGKCADIVGVVNLQKTGGNLRSWTRDDSPATTTAANKYFNGTYASSLSVDQITALGQLASGFKLTWEGITDGDLVTYGGSPGTHSVNSGALKCVP
jgi:hypothetical protein